MLRRCVTSSLVAWGVYAGLFAVGALPILLGRRDSVGEAFAVLVPIAGGLGAVNALLLVTTAGPVILWLRARFGQGLAPWHAALVGVGTFPLPVLLLWLVFREHGDTFGGLIRFWWRVPGELLLHAVPSALSGAAFGACLERMCRTARPADATGGDGRRRRIDALAQGDESDPPPRRGLRSR